MRILLVEDDDILRTGLRMGLSHHGFSVEAVGSVADARHALSAGDFDGVVLDRMLPDGSGFDILKQIRSSGAMLPVLLLTAHDDTSERIIGLDLGADDYVGKPFDLGELAARLRAIMRRSTERTESPLVWRDVKLDPVHLFVTRGDQTFQLRRREFALLEALMRRPGAVMSKGQIEERLYGWQDEIGSNTVEVHVHHIRQKLGSDFIETVRGLGYRLGGECP
jgi:two-component system response regulator QseB